jgi:hypothetical protein
MERVRSEKQSCEYSASHSHLAFQDLLWRRYFHRLNTSPWAASRESFGQCLPTGQFGDRHVPTRKHAGPMPFELVDPAVDLVSVKEILRHRDIQTTLRYFCNRDQNLTSQEREREEDMQIVDSLVRPEGLEPPTPRSVVWCSIH